MTHTKVLHSLTDVSDHDADSELARRLTSFLACDSSSSDSRILGIQSNPDHCGNNLPYAATPVLDDHEEQEDQDFDDLVDLDAAGEPSPLFDSSSYSSFSSSSSSSSSSCTDARYGDGEDGNTCSITSTSTSMSVDYNDTHRHREERPGQGEDEVQETFVMDLESDMGQAWTHQETTHGDR